MSEYSRVSVSRRLGTEEVIVDMDNLRPFLVMVVAEPREVVSVVLGDLWGARSVGALERELLFLLDPIEMMLLRICELGSKSAPDRR